MADFDKLPNLDKTGWNKAKGTQALTLGKSTYIGLFGKGPNGEDLLVSSASPTICITHEEPAPKAAGWRLFLLTSLQDGNAVITARTSAGAVVASFTVQITGKSGVRMVFFPGELTKLNVDGINVTMGTVYVIGAAGQNMKVAAGPPGMPAGGKLVAGQAGHTQESTPPGNYVLGPQEHVTTSSWPASVVPWSAPLRINAAKEVEFQGKSGHWTQATGPSGVVTRALTSYMKRNGTSPSAIAMQALARSYFLDLKTGKLLTSTYQSNDFGRWGWNLLRNGKRTGYYLHTTPENENSYTSSTFKNLVNSHGCIHMIPQERDRFLKAGLLKEGVPFEVRPYSETGPP